MNDSQRYGPYVSVAVQSEYNDLNMVFIAIGTTVGCNVGKKSFQ